MREYILILDYQYTIKKDFSKNYVFFLNKKSYQLNKNIFKLNDFKIFKNFRMDRNDRIKNYKYLDEINHKILEILTLNLNQLHGVKFKKNQWNILLGSWLFYFLSALFNRYLKLKNFLNILSDVKVYIEKNESSIETFSTHEFLNNIHISDNWNASIYYDLLKELKVKTLVSYKNEPLAKKNLLINYKISKKRQLLSKILNIFFTPFSKNKSLIIQSYLPLFQEIYLNYKVNGVPIISIPKKLYIEDNISNFNYIFQKNQILDKNEFFYNFTNKIIKNQIPTIFTKYFFNLKNIVSTLPWPTEPKTIFTSNLYETDEVFKMYVVLKSISTKTKYIIGQHGNSYNITIQSQYNPETQYPDNFISWSSQESNKKHICLGNFTDNSNFKKIKYFNLKKILIVMRSKGLDYEVFDRPSMNRNYMSYLIYFLRSLKSETRKKILLKPHFSYNKDNFLNKLKKYFPEINVLQPNISINKFYEDKTTFVIFNYDSSGIYKTFNINKPSMSFWPNHFNHVRDNALSYYEQMEKLNIFFSNPKKMAKYLESLISNNSLGKWWFSDECQEFINKFNKRYNNLLENNKKIEEFKNILLSKNDY